MLASDLARTLATAPALVYFTKKDGTIRRMLTAPSAEGVSVRGGVCRVFDAEKGAWRSIRAESVVSVAPVNARPHRAPVAPVRPAAPAPSLSSDFGGGYVGHRGRRTARA